jgi:hypothetical protein
VAKSKFSSLKNVLDLSHRDCYGGFWKNRVFSPTTSLPWFSSSSSPSHSTEGDAFGTHRTLELRLLDIHHCQKKLEGVKLEIDDSAYPLVDKVITTLDPAEAFQDTDVAILLGGFPRKPGMQRNDLIAQNASIMKEHV